MFSSEEKEYYTTEGCGIFAMALSKAFVDTGNIYILSNQDEDAEPWSDDIPYEVTHVLFSINDRFYDVNGQVFPVNVAYDFDINNYGLKGPYSPEFFTKRFMGSSDNYPLYSVDDKEEMDYLVKKIKDNPHIYDCLIVEEKFVGLK